MAARSFIRCKTVPTYLGSVMPARYMGWTTVAWITTGALSVGVYDIAGNCLWWLTRASRSCALSAGWVFLFSQDLVQLWMPSQMVLPAGSPLLLEAGGSLFAEFYVDVVFEEDDFESVEAPSGG